MMVLLVRDEGMMSKLVYCLEVGKLLVGLVIMLMSIAVIVYAAGALLYGG